MAKINLAGNSGSDSSRMTTRFLGKSMLLSFLILAGTFGLYFGLVFYREMLARDFAATESESASRTALISGEKADRVADFSDRLTVIEAQLTETALPPTDSLSKIESALVPEANLLSYIALLEESSIKVKLSADSFGAVARQMVAFKQVFSSVLIDKQVEIGESGKIEASLTMIP